MDDARIRRELLEKYREIRRLRETEPAADTNEAARRLATTFPGALRELDQTPPGELLGTIERLASDEALLPHEIERFRAIFAYHEALRGLLEAKRWLGGRRDADEATRAAFKADEALSAEARSWAPSITRVARPPTGGLPTLAIDRVAERLSLPAATVRALVVPPVPRPEKDEIPSG